MSISVDKLVADCFDKLNLSQRFVPYVQQAEEEGYPNLAKLFRALVASETAREKRMRTGVVNHANEDYNFYVCPQCGLIYNSECPKKCLVDKTPGKEFIVVQ